LKICDPLERAIILAGVSSGLSSNEIIRLRVKEFKNEYDPKTEITTLNLRREKVRFDFVTFLSPECSRAVWDYVNFRNRTLKIDCEKLGKINKALNYFTCIMRSFQILSALTPFIKLGCLSHQFNVTHYADATSKV
jgi:hypothetical protein